MSLQSLRNASEKPLAKLLMGLLIFSFVGWGAASWILGDSVESDSLVRIGSESVSARQFEQERSRQFAQMGREMQQKMFADKTTLSYFNRQMLSNMIVRALIEMHARSLGLVVSPAAVANIIKQSPEFSENGAFSTDKFDAVLDMNGISEKSFADTVRAAALREMMLVSLSGAAEPPSFMTDSLFNARNATRDIEYSAVKYDQFSANGQPTEEQLREAYMKNHKMDPEYRTISYIMVGAKMTEPASYDRGLDSAKSIEDMLVAGDAMKDAAKKMRAEFRTFQPMTIQRKKADGTTYGDALLSAETMQNLWSMEQGLESEIIEVKNGFVIFRVEKIDPAHAIPFGERRTELVRLWKRAEQEKQAYAKANEILASGKKLQAAVNVSRTGGAPLEVLNAAFASEIGRPQIAAGPGVFYVMNVLKENPAKPNQAKKKELETEAAKMTGQQMLDDYTGFLQRKYKIRPNENMLKRMF
ncbi:MAG: SurA N-terminal domain-containing protein [Rickettsiales bacterium]|jgi:peptidyl-prolyl cis-trans isomerase D|nr:SurA N-terminal domain-containing protein [Rickettsiales bacterium]